ncbi:MAG: HAD-IA family hydrolase [Gammaproteobacteria bacterium]
MTHKYQVLTFDWDGTLMDSLAHITHCMYMAICDLGWPIQDPEQLKPLIGTDIGFLLAKIVPNYTPQQQDAFISRYRHYAFSIPQSYDLFHGTQELLLQLKQDGFQLAVATGKSRRGLELALDNTGVRHLFDFTICADEAFPKPHPQMLLELMLQLVVQPSDVLMIGDSEFDIDFARNAGVDAVAVATGVHDKSRLLASNPLSCFDNITELKAWLSQS